MAVLKYQCNLQVVTLSTDGKFKGISYLSVDVATDQILYISFHGFPLVNTSIKMSWERVKKAPVLVRVCIW